jgi:hypothetical protein
MVKPNRRLSRIPLIVILVLIGELLLLEQPLRCRLGPSSATIANESPILKPGHFAGFNRSLESLQGIAGFLNFSGD